jgi:crotonobetainyl-CoA:carnitine CoA-transferase CaiB-like acyl-CoA transferase
MGTEFPTIVPYRTYRTLDREVAIAVGSEKLWSAFCRAIGRAELDRDSRFETNPDRIRNRGELEPLLEGVFRQRPAAEWVEKLRGAGIPCSLVRNFREVAQDPQCQVREMFPVIEHPAAGRHRVTGTPVKLSETPGGPDLPAPDLGEHTGPVLREILGLDDAAIEELKARRVMFEPPG